MPLSKAIERYTTPNRDSKRFKHKKEVISEQVLAGGWNESKSWALAKIFVEKKQNVALVMAWILAIIVYYFSWDLFPPGILRGASVLVGAGIIFWIYHNRRLRQEEWSWALSHLLRERLGEDYWHSDKYEEVDRKYDQLKRDIKKASPY